jgi:hypothetical protein
MGLYDYSNDPYTDTLLQAVYGAKVEPIQPAGMNVSSPSYPAVASASSGGGADQDMADAGGGIGSMFGSFMKGQASDAGGWSNLPRHWGSKVGLAEPIVKPTPTMMPSASDPIGALEAMKGGISNGTTPYGSGQAGSWISGLMGGAGGAGASGAMGAAMPAAASAVTPALGPAMSLAQGKKKSAMGGALGLGAGVALAPFTGGLSLLLGPALGGFLGGMGEK